jgi:hypothetical protein
MILDYFWGFRLCRWPESRVDLLSSHDRSVQATGETFAAPLALPVLNMSVNPAFAIPDDSV